MTNSILDCDQIEIELQKLGADINACELHGTLCAMLCADVANTGENWYQSLVPEPENPNESYDEATQALELLREQSYQHLNDPTCDFQLLLPADDNDITSRTTGLSDWCQGFIMGLMMCGIKDFHMVIL